MEVVVSFKNNKNVFTFPEGSQLRNLNERIEEVLNLKSENLKIFLRGKTLKNPDEPLKNGMKFLLVENKGPMKVNNTPQYRPSMYSYLGARFDTLWEANHQEIINNGPPEGHIEPSVFTVNVLPNKPLYVRNSKGERCALSIESDAFCLITDDMKLERIFFSDITKSTVIPIPNHEGFVGIGINTANRGNSWIYFIPKQFQGVMKSLLAKR